MKRTSWTRREVLRLAAVLGIAPVLPSVVGCGTGPMAADGEPLPEYEFDGEPGPEGLFSHSVASGDPLPNAVILWTRIAPPFDEVVDVYWEVALDPDFVERVGAGWVQTDSDRDFTVKLDAVGLGAGQTYYYRFRSLGRTSPIGRTRTAPEGSVQRLRFAVGSCSRYNQGYFHAYRAIAEEPSLDFVLHLGDYIYEYGSQGPVRDHDPAYEIQSLDDYRRRYAQYRSDSDLQEAHRQNAFITVWDDHESANNSWRDGAQNHNESTEGSWAERRARAERAYSEWMPIRDQDDGRIFRHLAFGGLVDLMMLDTRLWGRDLSIPDTADQEGIRDPSRTLLGFDQEEWVAGGLEASQAQWVICGQQVILSPWKLVAGAESDGGGQIANTDGWDGYIASRRRFLDALQRAGDPDLIVLTGDVHSSWAFDITDDPSNPEVYDPETGRGSQGVEFVTPGITSPFFDATGVLADVFLGANPHLRWAETQSQGYMVLDVTRERAECAWYHFEDVQALETEQRLGQVVSVAAGSRHVELREELSSPPESSPRLAP